MYTVTYVRQNGGGETSHDTARQRDAQLLGGREVFALFERHAVVDELCAPFVHGKLAYVISIIQEDRFCR